MDSVDNNKSNQRDKRHSSSSLSLNACVQIKDEEEGIEYIPQSNNNSCLTTTTVVSSFSQIPSAAASAADQQNQNDTENLASAAAILLSSTESIHTEAETDGGAANANLKPTATPTQSPPPQPTPPSVASAPNPEPDTTAPPPTTLASTSSTTMSSTGVLMSSRRPQHHRRTSESYARKRRQMLNLRNSRTRSPKRASIASSGTSLTTSTSNMAASVNAVAIARELQRELQQEDNQNNSNNGNNNAGSIEEAAATTIPRHEQQPRQQDQQSTNPENSVLVDTLDDDDHGMNGNSTQGAHAAIEDEIGAALAEGRRFRNASITKNVACAPPHRSGADTTRTHDQRHQNQQQQYSRPGAFRSGQSSTTTEASHNRTQELNRHSDITVPASNTRRRSNGHNDNNYYSNSDENVSRPGAFSATGRAFGEYPAWGRGSVTTTTAAARSQQQQRQDQDHEDGPETYVRDEPLRRQTSFRRFAASIVRRLSLSNPPSLVSNASGGGSSHHRHTSAVVEASYVSDGVLVCYAESVENEAARHKRRMRIHIFLAIWMVVALGIAIAVAFHLAGPNTDGSSGSGVDDTCFATPRRQQDVRTECACFGDIQQNSAATANDEQEYWTRISQILIEEGVLPSDFANTTHSRDCNNTRSLAIQVLIEKANTTTLDIMLNATEQTIVPEIMLIQQFVLVLLYIEMNGDSWERHDGWLEPGGGSTTSCEWFGVLCAVSGRILHLMLMSNNLTGTLPTELGALSFLRELRMSENPGISGTLPSELLRIGSLRTLDIRKGSLIGTIPAGDDVLYPENALSAIDLSHNDLTGPIPSTLWRLERLRDVHLEHNHITGTLEGSGFNKTSMALETIFLQYNNMTGSIPTAIGNLQYLEQVHLRKNAMTGAIPTELSKLSRLSFVDFSFNKFDDISMDLVSCNRIATPYIETVVIDCNDFPTKNQTCAETDCCFCSDAWVPPIEREGF